MAFNKKDAKDCAVGIGFLLPNILGFMAFTVTVSYTHLVNSQLR